MQSGQEKSRGMWDSVWCSLAIRRFPWATRKTRSLADAWAFRKLLTIGRSRDEALAFPQHACFRHEQEQAESAASQDPASENRVVEEIRNHFRSHPPAQERTERLKKIKS